MTYKVIDGSGWPLALFAYLSDAELFTRAYKFANGKTVTIVIGDDDG